VSQPASIQRGIALALAVAAAMPVLDLGYSAASYLATVAGLVPPVSASIAIAVRALLVVILLCGKLYLLLTLIYRPARLDWMVRSWTIPIVLAVLGVAAIPVSVLLATLDAIAIFAARDGFMAQTDAPVGDMVSAWVTGHGILHFATALATAAIWAAMLLLAYRRSRAPDC
jgi:hypothetical protein